MNENTAIICEAIENTKKVVPGYFEKTIGQRLSSSGCGSVFEPSIQTFEDAEQIIRSANWVRVDHPNVAPGATAYKTTDISGRIGVIELKTLPPDQMVVLEDRKNTGKLSCHVNGVLGPMVNETYIIIGPEQDVPVVYTIHPGEPIKPSQVEATPGLDGKEIPISVAINDYGFEFAKVA